MTELMRVKIRWSGFNGGPGYTVLHFRDFDSAGGGGGSVTTEGAQGAVARTRTFFNAIAGTFPATVAIQVEAEVDVLEDTTGDLVRSIGTAPVAVVQGTQAGVYSAAVGAVVNWKTEGVRNARRVRGRSFLVPMASVAFNNQGVLVPGTVTQIQTAANELVAVAGFPDLMVYGRPTSPTANDGVAYRATSSSVPAKGAVLRSRRD